MEKYLTIGEAASLCRVKPETIRDRMKAGVYRLGIHYFRPARSRPLFKESALIGWIEGDELKVEDAEPEGKSIPMIGGYFLGQRRRAASFGRQGQKK